MAGAGTIRIGISGWTYPPWRGVFYPKGWPQKRELEYAATQVSSIEINGSFYSLQRPESYQAWAAATPDNFVFSVKGSRYITHLRRLKEIEVPLANFFASGVLLLGQKLGPFLWQLPPSMPYDPDRLDKFLKLLPRDTSAAARLARKHDQRVSGRKGIKSGGHCILRHALEVRHPSFETRDFVELLRDHQVALVVADTAGKWPFLEDVTSDFVYVRLHGDKELYASGYTTVALGKWAQKIRAWGRGANPGSAKRIAPRAPASKGGRDVFVYFDNDVKVHAPFDAIALAHRLGLRQSERV